MELQEALDTLGEESSKKILTRMFRSLLTLNAQGKGLYLHVSDGTNIVSKFDLAASPVIPQLVDSAYNILTEEKFDNPQRWYDEIYTPQIHPNINLTVEKMIEELRQQRAESVARRILKSDIPYGAKILDYGVGSGTNMLELSRQRPDVTIHGFDPNEYVREELKQSGQYKHISTPEALDDDYDLTVLSWVLHHASENEHQTILETIHDNLKPNGDFIFLETLISQQPATSLEEQKHLYAAAILKDAVSSNGMLPKYPYTGTEISGYYDRPYWEDTLNNAGFEFKTQNAYLSAEMDGFTEQSLILACRKTYQSQHPKPQSDIAQITTHLDC